MTALSRFALAEPEAVADCHADPNVFCMSYSRVTVGVTWTNPYSGTGGTAGVLPQGDEFAYFYFTDPKNPEVFVKALGDNNPDSIQLFVGGTTDFDYTVTFTGCGTQVTFHKPPYIFVGTVSNSAIPNRTCARGLVYAAAVPVTSLNGLTGAVTLAPGSNVTLTPSGNTLTIASSGGSGGGITGITAGTGLTGGGSSGNVPLGIANGGVGTAQLGDGAVSKAKLAAGGGASGQVLGTDGNTILWQSVSSGVPSVNGITSAVTIAGSGGSTVGTAGSTITVNSPSSLPPSGPAGGDLTGTYPNPTLKLPYIGTATSAEAAFYVSNSGSGNALWGAGSSGAGVIGMSDSSSGAYGHSNSFHGVFGRTENAGRSAVFGQNNATGATGCLACPLGGAVGTVYSGDGVYGASSGGYGVHGLHANYEGFLGYSDGGVVGRDNNSGHYGYLGMATRAGYFSGDVDISGNLTKTTGSFKIDHPLDPQNKYLYHSFVESPDMKNVYDGIAVLDGGGEAVVQLPAYFEALNGDYRYQLTCIGGFSPVYVADEIRGNAFRIAGGTPGMRVSWQVTGIRRDSYARAHPIVPEVDKPDGERGLYLHPVEQGASEEMGVDWETQKKLKREYEENMKRAEESRKIIIRSASPR